MNIVLIGFRGAGKSSLADILSKKLSMRVISSDALIEEHEEKSIQEIVEKNGWEYFRDVESAVIEKISDEDESVIDTGGGVVENPLNIDHLRVRGFIVYVSASLKDIKNRIIHDSTRPKLNPLLNTEDDIVFAYNRRNPLYEEFMDFRVNTSTHTIEECAAQIIKEIEK
ncbi:MAG: shikimate kinase [Ignavibacteria bacterium]|nr:shikimate kinase [Ignavibacteria bacterium]